ncbi:sensor histidine kinase [Luteimonas sp. BDR2-5]|uniref:sensor histidine kinase n=1 Tax=Proluteimonas luteida TaxID=2878685 RepID=UPI001E30DEAB|nr:ATP-binding protein [Luteimonas sp. BDR2-5]MCD9027969.1 sensor histidine kinase [Luteimonas sp. BDR2-5]
MFDAIRRWLNDVPIDDPVDRRNAAALQLLLLFLLISVPATWTYFLTQLGMPRGGALNVGLAALTTVVVGFCLAMIRAGHFRPAVMLYLGTLLATMWINYAKSGFQVMMVSQSDQFLALLLGGLVLGRRALWLIFLVLLAIVVTGCLTDYPARGGRAFENAPSTAMAYFIVAIMLDRAVAALREALHDSDTRRAALQREMAARERAQAQLVHAKKVEATGQLASGVSHDFNNVLSVILGYAQQRERLADRDKSALVDALAGVETEARRALEINRKLLDFSRQEILRPEVFDVRQALAELQPMLRQLFPAQVRVRIEAGDDGLHVRLDRASFILMMLNIAGNARDAMPGGGTFTIASRLHHGDDGAQVELTLHDTGSGIPDTVRARIFEPFYTTKPAGSGTGLGLSLVHDMIHSAHGTIDVDSTPGAGTRFRILLPHAGTGADADAAETAIDRPETAQAANR